MSTIYLDPSITHETDWDEVVSAALEQVQFAVDEWQKAHPNSKPTVGDLAKFEIEVKVKDLNGSAVSRNHNQITVSTKNPGMTFLPGLASGSVKSTTSPAGWGSTAAPPSHAAAPAGSGGLWGPQPTNPILVKTPPKSSGKVPHGIPVQVVSSSAKCFECGGPGTLMFNSIQCHNSKCKGSR